MAKKRIAFSIKASDAQVVLLAGEFTGWERDAIVLKKLKGGHWKTTVTLEPGRYEYRFIVDGQWCCDPSCSEQVPNGLGSENSICRVI